MSGSQNISISAIAALTKEGRVIGKNGDIPWDIPEDLQRFKKLTNEKAVIMGRKTWESLPEAVRPLPDRENIVLTRNENYEAKGAAVTHSLDEALDYAHQWSKKYKKEEFFIIGGEAVYKKALPRIDSLYLTLVDLNISGDTHFPSYTDEFIVIEQESFPGNNPSYAFVNLTRPQ